MPVAGHGVLTGLAEVTESASAPVTRGQPGLGCFYILCLYFFFALVSPFSLALTPRRDQHLSFWATLDAPRLLLPVDKAKFRVGAAHLSCVYN